MERMTDYKPQERQDLEELYRKQNVRINELEEENKKLKSDLEECECSMHFENDEVGYRKKENKKLNIKVASLEGEIKGLNSTIEKLKEENQYRESIADVLPEGEGHIAEETIQDLQKEIKRLNVELDKAHTAYRAVRKINQELMNGYV